MSKQIAIKDGDKKYWISIDEFKKLLFKEEISTKGVPLAYPERVEAFFNQLHSHKILHTWREAYPNVDLATGTTEMTTEVTAAGSAADFYSATINSDGSELITQDTTTPTHVPIVLERDQASSNAVDWHGTLWFKQVDDVDKS